MIDTEQPLDKTVRQIRRLLEEVWDERTPNEREALLRRAREIKEEAP